MIDHREGGLGNVLYAEFGSFEFDTVNSREFFEMDEDPWQKHNRYEQLTDEERRQWATRVGDLFGCKGAACRMESVA